MEDGYTKLWILGKASFDTIVSFFFSLNPHQVQEALENIPQVVTKPSNFDPIGTFHEWVVLDALKQMAPLKAPSLNGMPPLFYQHF